MFPTYDSYNCYGVTDWKGAGSWQVQHRSAIRTFIYLSLAIEFFEHASSARAGWISSIPSVEAHERILYANFLKVNQEVKDMIAEIQEFYKKWGRLLSIQSKFTHNSSDLYCCKKKKNCNFALQILIIELVLKLIVVHTVNTNISS